MLYLCLLMSTRGACLTCLSFISRRSGRGDRSGRYGNTHNDHNFRDMDYRDYGQEDGEGDPNRPYGHEEESQNVHDFQNQLGFHQRGDGQREIGRGGKGHLCPPPCPPQLDLALPLLHREGEESRLEFEQSRTGPGENPRGNIGRNFPENTARDGNWCYSRVNDGQMEYNAARQREDKLTRGPMKRRVSCGFLPLFKAIKFHVLV